MTFEKNPLRHHLALWAGFLSSFDDLYVRYHISEIGSKRLILKKYVSLQNEQSRIKYKKIYFFSYINGNMRKFPLIWFLIHNIRWDSSCCT